MTYKQRFVTTIFFILYFLFVQAQNKKKIDSLFNVLNSTSFDTTKVNTLSALSFNFSVADSAKAFQYARQGVQLAQKINYKKGIATCYNNIGIVYKNSGNYFLALENYKKALAIFEETEDKKGIAKTYIIIGVVYSEQSDFTQAMEFYQKAQKIYELLNDKAGMAKSYSMLGIVSTDKGDYPKATEYYLKSLKINEALGDKKSLLNCYTNLGEVHNKQYNYTEALEYYQLALNIANELKQKRGILVCFNGIGNVYMKLGGESKVKGNDSVASVNYDKAIVNYNKVLAILEETGDKKSKAVCYNNIGWIYKDQENYTKGVEYFLKALNQFEALGAKVEISVVSANIADLDNKLSKFNEAINYAEKSLEIAKEIGSLENQRFAHEKLFASYKGLGKFKEALINHERYTKLNDSIYNNERDKQVKEMESKYQNEKKKKEIELLNKNKALQQTEIKQQRTQKYAFVGGFILMLILAVVILRSYREKKKANILLESQKKVIEEKNEDLNQKNHEISSQKDAIEKQKEHIELIHEDLTDSIRYAERIQNAVLPSKEILSVLLSDFFVIFKPKDIVSGDFYYIAKRDNWILLSVADCTGHGVPGAFMCMLGVSSLNEIIARNDITQASQVLNELRQYLIASLHQSGARGEQQDGMDMIFVAINLQTMELQFAGAHNPLWIFKQIKDVNVDTNSNNNLQYDFIEIKADPMPVGIYAEMNEFTNHKIKLEKGDIFYLSSDGIKDQFGGPNKKKFMAKRVKEL